MAAFAVLSGALAAAILRQDSYLDQMAALLVGGVLLVGCALAHAWFCERPRTVVVSGALLAAVFFFTMVKAVLLPSSFLELGTLAGGILFVAACGGAVTYLVCKLARTVVIRFVTQDGSRCPSCAYDVAHLPDRDKCPECGTDVSGTLHADESALATYNQNSPYVLAILLLLVLGLPLARAVPTFFFLRQFTQYISDTGAQEMYSNIIVSTHEWARGRGAIFPVPQDPAKVVLLVAAYRSEPVMQIRLCWTSPWNPAFPPIDGLPPIVCNLDRRSADQVVEDGVPSSLILAMLEASEQANWPAALPAPIGGAIGLSALGDGTPIFVSGEDHFRSGASGR